MASIKQARNILREMGMPPAQCNDMAALTLMALCGLDRKAPWSAATRAPRTVSKDIMSHVRIKFGRDYAPNTRETFRRQVLHQFMQAFLADYNAFQPDLPTNSPRAHYAITPSALAAINQYGAAGWTSALKQFRSEHGTLVEAYARNREIDRVAIHTADGRTLSLSPGKHNRVQKAIIEDFAPRFAGGSRLLYVGDTALKKLLMDSDSLRELGFLTDDHDKLPDVILYHPEKTWLYLIEAVTSHGPVTPKRILELEFMLKTCKAGIVYVSAFPNMAEFKKHAKNIAWETEVWLADMPDHLIHFNGDRFFGPRSRS